ncbi:MAG: efflux RND transporter periplasmic adaptor subunit [Betaproteobacteria bacterium]|nr:efflux RND transporter periplasmic adaptor subunit [Betaproteobacteria bacterium]
MNVTSFPCPGLGRVTAGSVLVVAALLGGCKQKDEGQAAAHQGPPPQVNVVTVTPKDLPLTFEYVGQTAGVREVEVRPRVGGILLHWNYTEGTRVKAGQSLFTIDPAPFRANVARLEASLAGARARHDQTTREAARIKPLLEQGMVTRKSYDDATAADEIAAADEQAARAALDEARLELGYTNVAAPIAGVTGLAAKSEGSLVEAQQTLLTTITQIDPIHVIFNIPEPEHMRIKREAAQGIIRLPPDGRFDAEVTLADGSVYPRTGKVDFTNVRVDPSTSSIEARAVMPNPDLVLRPGQFARVKLSGAVRPDTITVPQRAVLEGPGSKIVLTVNAKGVVEPRPVEVGEWGPGDEWIITKGLHAGDRVITDGMIKARPGSPVTITQTPAVGGAPKGDGPAGGDSQAPSGQH